MEWTTRDKAAWGPGEWQGEPDKVQWVDEATGLDCLIVRNPGGALCGYVGVSESHPLYGVGYSQCSIEAKGGVCPDRNPEESWHYYCDHRPESRFEVHGGLTFADSCHEPTEEQWFQVEAKLNDPATVREAAKYPRGDSAQRLVSLREQSGMTLEEWIAYQQARRICHVPAEGRPAKVWWFGFDCGHSGDICPGYQGLSSAFRSFGDSYKDRSYVEAECAKLAQQLNVALASPVSPAVGGDLR